MAPVKTLAWALFMAADFAAAHSVITNAVGDAGGSGMALGVDSSTPRDGTNRQPFQTDATRFRGDSAATVGETLAGGTNNVEQGTTDIMEETGDQLPQISQGGSVEMTLHQVNSDGAGPYTCMINDDGTGNSWSNIPVTTNVEGNRRGRNRDGEMGDFPLVASIPNDQTCTGSVAGEDNVCLVRCQNPARAGPFGGVVPVQMAQPNAGNTGNANTGNANTGNANTGNANTGNANAGNANTGNANAGAAPANGGNAGQGTADNANTGNATAEEPAAGNANNAGNAQSNNGNTEAAPAQNNNKNDDDEEEEGATTGAAQGSTSGNTGSATNARVLKARAVGFRA